VLQAEQRVLARISEDAHHHGIEAADGRWMMSTWPLVTGSKVPGHRAVRPIVVCLLRSRDTEYEDDAVPVGEPPFELPVYWNYRHVSSGGTAHHHPAARGDNSLTCYFGEQCVEVGLLKPVGGIQHDQVEGPRPLPDGAQGIDAPNLSLAHQLGPAEVLVDRPDGTRGRV